MKLFLILLNLVYYLGIKEEFLEDVCLSNEQMFKILTKNGDIVIEILDILQKTTKQPYENVMRFFAK